MTDDASAYRTVQPEGITPEGNWWEDETDYRRGRDGDWYSPSTRTALCHYCGVWYNIDDAHGKVIGGCEPSPLPV